MWKKRLEGVFCVLLLPLTAAAGQFCGKHVVPANVRTCPDGSIPLFVADEVKPYVAPGVQPYVAPQAKPHVAPQASREPGSPQARADSNAPGRANLNYFFGVWRTRIPGAVWTSPSGYQGYDWLHVSAGAAAGDLIIKPDGTYVWASYGGKSGSWVRGDGDYPIVLIDTVENRRWKVGRDLKRIGGRDIMVWDGNSISYDGRK